MCTILIPVALYAVGVKRLGESANKAMEGILGVFLAVWMVDAALAVHCPSNYDNDFANRLKETDLERPLFRLQKNDIKEGYAAGEVITFSLHTTVKGSFMSGFVITARSLDASCGDGVIESPDVEVKPRKDCENALASTGKIKPLKDLVFGYRAPSCGCVVIRATVDIGSHSVAYVDPAGVFQGPMTITLCPSPETKPVLGPKITKEAPKKYDKMVRVKHVEKGSLGEKKSDVKIPITETRNGKVTDDPRIGKEPGLGSGDRDVDTDDEDGYNGETHEPVENKAEHGDKPDEEPLKKGDDRGDYSFEEGQTRTKGAVACTFLENEEWQSSSERDEGSHSSESEEDIFSLESDEGSYSSESNEGSYNSESDEGSYSSESDKGSYSSESDEGSYSSESDEGSYSSESYEGDNGDDNDYDDSFETKEIIVEPPEKSDKEEALPFKSPFYGLFSHAIGRHLRPPPGRPVPGHLSRHPPHPMMGLPGGFRRPDHSISPPAQMKRRFEQMRRRPGKPWGKHPTGPLRGQVKEPFNRPPIDKPFVNPAMCKADPLRFLRQLVFGPNDFLLDKLCHAITTRYDVEEEVIHDRFPFTRMWHAFHRQGAPFPRPGQFRGRRASKPLRNKKDKFSNFDFEDEKGKWFATGQKLKRCCSERGGERYSCIRQSRMDVVCDPDFQIPLCSASIPESKAGRIKERCCSLDGIDRITCLNKTSLRDEDSGLKKGVSFGRINHGKFPAAKKIRGPKSSQEPGRQDIAKRRSDLSDTIKNVGDDAWMYGKKMANFRQAYDDRNAFKRVLPKIEKGTKNRKGPLSQRKMDYFDYASDMGFEDDRVPDGSELVRVEEDLEESILDEDGLVDEEVEDVLSSIDVEDDLEDGDDGEDPGQSRRQRRMQLRQCCQDGRRASESLTGRIWSSCSARSREAGIESAGRRWQRRCRVLYRKCCIRTAVRGIEGDREVGVDEDSELTDEDRRRPIQGHGQRLRPNRRPSRRRPVAARRPVLVPRRQH